MMTVRMVKGARPTGDLGELEDQARREQDEGYFGLVAGSWDVFLWGG
jgi:hypothetical protein